MKAKNIAYLYILAGLLLASCSKNVDNYPAPDAGIQGSLTDGQSGNPFQSEEPNGFRIRLIAEAYKDATPIDFWGKPDGTFENTKVFSGDYKVIPIEGAFFPVDTQEVSIAGLKQIDFKVTPFLTVTASATAHASSIVTQYKISRTRIEGKISTCKSLVSVHPAISNTVFDKAITHDLSEIDDDTILDTTFRDSVPDLKSGQTYYVRIAVYANNPLNKYNYSPVIKIAVP